MRSRKNKKKMTSVEAFKRLMRDEALKAPCDEHFVKDKDVDVPPWFDQNLFTRGRKFILKNLAAQLVACLCGLITVLAVPNSLKIMINTNKSSTSLAAYRRYLSTILHTYTWICHDLTPDTQAWKSLVTVRRRHLAVSKQSHSKGLGMIAQKDLVVTLFGFFGYGLLKPKEVGMRFEEEGDQEAYLHFWRTIGFMVGVHDKYNFCEGSVENAIKKAEFICEDLCKPHLINPPEYFFHMVKSMLDGLYCISVLIVTKPFLYYTYRINNIDGFKRLARKENHTANSSKNIDRNFNTVKNIDKDFITVKNIDKDFITVKNIDKDNCLDGSRLFDSLSGLEWCVVVGMVMAFQRHLFTALGRWFYNMLFRITLFSLQYIPYAAFLRYGFQGISVNIFKDDIAIPTQMKTNREVLNELYQKNLIL